VGSVMRPSRQWEPVPKQSQYLRGASPLRPKRVGPVPADAPDQATEQLAGIPRLQLAIVAAGFRHVPRAAAIHHQTSYWQGAAPRR